MIKYTTQIRARYCETDAMGIVHHANYINWFELARVEMMDFLELPYTTLEAQGYFMPVLEVNIEYIAPSKFDDRIQAEVTVNEPPKARLQVNYTLTRDDKIIAKGHTKHTFINKEGRPVRPPENYLEVMHKHFS